jgi:beta-glucanase (GH16 family)
MAGVVLALAVLAAGCSGGVKKGGGMCWKLVWADEFQYDGAPDQRKWKPEVGMIRNNELQIYTENRRENARVEGGMLVLEARKEPWEKAAYTSASLTTAERQSWTYGKFEIRAKIPSGRGMWPAIWMLGESIGVKGWPACGELDIMENVGFDPDRIVCSAHTKSYNHVIKTQRSGVLELKNPSADFHVYSMEWSKSEVIFRVDEREVYRFSNDGKGEDSWPFNSPHYLILNIAVGGGWGGQQGVDDSIFPQKMLVDYVRVYQREKWYFPFL